MSYLSVAIIVMASIAFYAGVNHFVIYLGRRQRRHDRTFGLTCLTVGLYNVGCAGLYSAGSVASGASWARLQALALALFSIMLPWFIYDYTRQWRNAVLHKKVLQVATVYYASMGVAQAVARSDWFWMEGQPAIKRVALPFGNAITYYELAAGPLTVLQYVATLIGLGYILWGLGRFYRLGQKDKAWPLLLAMLVTTACAANDSAISSGIYTSIYLLEYSYLAMILLMGHTITQEILEATEIKEALQESERRFFKLAENARDVIYRYRLTPSPGYEYISPSIQTVTGYSPEEYYADAALATRLVYPEDRHLLDILLNPSLTSPRDVTLRWVRKDGSVLWAEQRNAPVHDDDGKMVAIEGIARDITERKLAETEIAAWRQRFELATGAARQIVYDYDLVTGQIAWSGSIEAVLGYTLTEMSGGIDQWVALIHADDRPKALRLLEIADQANTPYDVEYRFCCKDGRYIWMHDQGQFIAAGPGDARRMLGMMQDISAQKQAEAERMRLISIIEATSDLVSLVRPDGQLISLNRAGRAMLGWESIEPSQKHLQDAHPAWALRMVQDVAIPTAVREGIWQGETALLNPAGGEIPVSQVIVAHRSPGGELEFLSTIIRDISERRQIEEQLRIMARFPEENPNPVLRVDRNGVLLYANLASRLLLAQWGSQVGQRLPPDWAQWAAEALATGSAQEIEMPFDGAVYSIILSPILDMGYVNLYGRDITERKRAEAALQASEAKFRNIVERSPMGMHIYRLESDGRLIFIGANPAADAILGVDNAQFIGKTIEEAFPPLAQTEVPERYRQSCIIGETWHAEQIDYQDEHIRGTFDVYAFQTSPGMMAAAFIEITERKRAEQALEDARLMLEAVINQSPVPIVVVSAPDQVVRYANAAAVEFLGLTDEPSYIGLTLSEVKARRSWRDLGSDGTPIPLEEMPLALALRGHTTTQQEYRALRKDGSTRWEMVSGAPIYNAFGQLSAAMIVFPDITALKEAEAALRRERDLVSRVMETSPAGIVVLNRRGQIDFANPQAEKVLGLERAAIHQRAYNSPEWGITDYDGKPFPDKHLPFTRVMITGQPVFDVRHAIEWPDGRRVLLSINAAPLLDPAGQVDGVVAMVEDVTEQVKSAQALQVSEERYRSLFDRMPLGLYRSTPDGRFLDVNLALIEMLGYPNRQALLDDGVTGYVDPAERQHWQALLESQGVLSGFEFQWRRPGGQVIWVSDSAQVARDAQGQVLFYEGVLENITGRKQVETALQQYNQRLKVLHDVDRAILEAASSSEIASATLDHIRRLAPCQRASVVLFDFQAAEVTILASFVEDQSQIQADRTLSIDDYGLDEPLLQGQVVILDDLLALPELSKVRQQLVAEGVRSVVNVPLSTQEKLVGALNLGARSPGAFSAENIEVAMELGDVLTVAIQQARLHEQVQRHARDMEERVRQRTAELEAKNRELETFAYSVSHDLKAPLRGIDGYSRLLIDDYADRLDEDGRAFLQAIRQATDQMNQLIDDLLAYSRLERRTLIKTDIPLTAVVQAVVAERRGEIKARNVSLKISTPDESIKAEIDGLSQALRNLLDNALKFTQGIDKPEIEIGGQKLPVSCIVWVKDNGVGFDMQYHDRIFEIFQRLHRAEDYPGTGIGLALVRKVMQRLGGRAWAESVPGRGSTFYLELPK